MRAAVRALAGALVRTGGSVHGRLLKLAPSARWGVGFAVAAGLGAAALLVVQMLLLSWIVRDVLFRHQTLDGIMPLVIAAGCAMAGRSGLIALRELIARRTAIRVKRELRERLAEHLFRLGPAYITGERTGDLVATATDGIERLDPYISRYLPQIALGTAVPLGIVLAILPVDPLSAGLLLFTVPVIVLLMVLIGTFTRDHVQRQWETLGRLGDTFLDIVQGLPTLLLLDRDEGARRRVIAISQQFRDRTLSVLKVAFLSGAVLELMTAAGIGLIATVLGVRLLDGVVPFDRAFFVFLLTPEFYRPLRELGTHRHAAIEGTAAAERLLEILQSPVLDERMDGDGATVPEGPLAIELTDVSYRYPERDRPALSHLSLTLPPGTCTAVIGRSGAGKSTLINLLLRAMDPTEGAVAVNGVALSGLPVDAWRERVALVSQRPHLFRGTLRENIRLARPDAREEEVMCAAELAGCSSFLAELPNGLDTVVGERGEGLSAGQRQRLAIARAFLKDAPLLLLDEPTSALDPESEAQIREALARLMRDRTVVVVAHRLNTIRAADRIAVLDAGCVIEVGRPEELLARGGVYASLVAGERWEAIPA